MILLPIVDSQVSTYEHSCFFLVPESRSKFFSLPVINRLKIKYEWYFRQVIL